MMKSIFDKRVVLARSFAKTYHEGQLYGKEFPYLIHLQATVSVLIYFDIDDVDMLAAGWLHDVLEDTCAPSTLIESTFGPSVLEIIQAVTEPKGGNRAWRHEQTYPRIKRDVRFVVIKLADRIANVQAGGTQTGMYRKEHPSFKKELREYDVAKEHLWLASKCEAMWEYLDSLIIEIPLTKEK